LAIVGQVEKSHRTAQVTAKIDALIRQQRATFVSDAYVIYYSFQANGVTISRSTVVGASQWSNDDRTGIVCYDPTDTNNQILLRPDQKCPG
jgi:hypothetical protein